MRRDNLLEKTAVRTGDTERTHLLVDIRVTASILVGPTASALGPLCTLSRLLGLLVALLDFFEGASEWLPPSENVFGIGIGDVLTVP